MSSTEKQSVAADVYLASCTANDEPGTGSTRPRRVNHKRTTSHSKRARTSKRGEVEGANEDNFRELKSADRRAIRGKASGMTARWDHREKGRVGSGMVGAVGRVNGTMEVGAWGGMSWLGIDRSSRADARARDERWFFL